MLGSSLENRGGAGLLNAIQDLLPSPLQHAAWMDEEGNERPSSPDEPLALLTFKTLSDPFSGQLSIMRVLSGSFNGDATLKNINQDETERIGSPLFMNGKEFVPAKGDIGGSIIAVPKLKATKTGDTLADPKATFKVLMPELPPNLISYAIAPKEKGDEDKIYTAVQRLLDEDITLTLSRDAESSDILLSGMGQLHIETSVERAMRRYKCNMVLKTPKIPYRETIKGKHKFKADIKNSLVDADSSAIAGLKLKECRRASATSLKMPSLVALSLVSTSLLWIKAFKKLRTVAVLLGILSLTLKYGSTMVHTTPLTPLKWPLKSLVPLH